MAKQGKEKRIFQRFSIPGGIKRRWLLNNVSLVLIAIVMIFFTVSIAVRSYYYSSVQAGLVSRTISAKYLNRYMSNSFDEFYYYADQLVRDFSDKDKVEMQVIDVYGRVMFSSTGLTAGFIPGTSDVFDCLDKKQAVTFTGYDVLTGERVMSAVAPVFYKDGRMIGMVRYVTSLKLLDKQLGYIYAFMAAGAAGLLALIIISNQFFIRSIVNPVLKINDLAKKIAGGQYGARLDVEFNDEIGELCTTINNMSEEIGRMEKLKNDFISSVSHELRTPLTAINGWTETIANVPEDKAMVASGLAIIQKETQRLSQMVEELLDFSRIESGRLKLHTEVFDLRGEVYDAVFTYTELLKQEGMEVSYSEGDEPIWINGDKNRMKQVFLNVIDNAAKYGKSGKKIDITVDCEGGFALAKVRDFGQGIPKEELPFVREKFFKGSARGRGAGIGLAVCTEIISMHSGDLEIDSVYGEGTEITIRIPLTERQGGYEQSNS